MALLSMCLDAGVPCMAAHVNYHQRKQADEEEAYIRLFCAEKQIPLFVRNEPFAYTGNFEAAARAWRYDWFAGLIRENHLKGVLTAHHEDDLLETYFMQEEKNLVPAYYGLKEEMMYHGVLVKRPLLAYTKAQLLEYCQAHQIRYFIDHTNADVSFARNRIRSEIVSPLSRMERDMVLREIRMKNAEAQERMCRVGTFIRDGRTELGSYRKLNEEDRLVLLRKMIEKDRHYSLSFVKQLDSVLMKKDDFDLPVDERHLVQEDGTFFMAFPGESYAYTFFSKEEMASFEGSPYFRIEKGEPGIYAVSLSEEDFPLTIRSAKEGDRIEMRFGFKNVHRFFIDRHIPLYRRTSWPVAENRDGRVILVPGLGCDVSHFSTSPDFNVLQLTSSYLKKRRVYVGGKGH